MAPEMPTATYSCGDTVLPVCPTWNWCGYQPASVTARDAPTAAPSESASFSMSAMLSAEPTPRPPETTIDASVSSGLAPACCTTRSLIRACVAASLTAMLTGSIPPSPPRRLGARPRPDDGGPAEPAREGHQLEGDLLDGLAIVLGQYQNLSHRRQPFSPSALQPLLESFSPVG